MSLLDAYDPYVFMFWLWIIQEFPYFGLNNDSWVCLMRMIHMFLWSGFERSMSFHILVWIMIHEFVACIQYDPYVFMFWFWTINEFPYFGLNNDSWVCWMLMIHMFLCSGFELSRSFHILVWIMIHEFVWCVWSICFYGLVLNDPWVSIFWFE